MCVQSLPEVRAHNITAFQFKTQLRHILSLTSSSMDTFSGCRLLHAAANTKSSATITSHLISHTHFHTGLSSVHTPVAKLLLLLLLLPSKLQRNSRVQARYNHIHTCRAVAAGCKHSPADAPSAASLTVDKRVGLHLQRDAPSCLSVSRCVCVCGGPHSPSMLPCCCCCCCCYVCASVCVSVGLA